MTTTAAPSVTIVEPTGSSAGPFATTWLYAAAADVVVQIETDGVLDDPLQQGVDYTLTGATPLTNGGSVTLDAGQVPVGGWTASHRIIISRQTARQQALALPDSEGHKPRSTEKAFDKAMRVAQEQDALLERAAKGAPGEPGPHLRTAARRASKVAVFDAHGDFDPDARDLTSFDADVAQTAADRVATGEDRVATAGHLAAIVPAKNAALDAIATDRAAALAAIGTDKTAAQAAIAADRAAALAAIAPEVTAAQTAATASETARDETLQAILDAPNLVGNKVSKDGTDLTDANRTALLDALTYDFSDGSTGAPRFSMPNIARRLYEDVAAHCPPSDAVDAYAGIVLALAAGAGRTVYFSNPIGGTRNYLLTDRADPTFTVAPNTRIVAGDGAILDFSALGTSGTRKAIFTASGSATSTVALASDAAAAAKTITLAAGGVAALGGVVRGDYLKITSNKDFVSGSASSAKQGEFVCVRSVAGEVITLQANLQDSYAVADTAVVRKVTMARNVTIEGLRAIGSGRRSSGANDAFAKFEMCLFPRLLDCDLFNVDTDAGWLYDCDHPHVLGNRIEMPDVGANSSAQYGISYNNACQNVKIGHNQIFNGRHSIAHGGSNASYGGGVARDVEIFSNECQGAGTAIVQHESSERTTIHHNIIRGCGSGIEFGSRGVYSHDNRVIGMDTTNGGISAGFYGSEFFESAKSENDYVEGFTYGFFYTGSQLAGSEGPMDLYFRDFQVIGATGGAFILNPGTIASTAGWIEIDGLVTRGGGGVSCRVTGAFEMVRLSRMDLSGNSGGFACVQVDGSPTDVEAKNIRWEGHNPPLMTGTRVRVGDNWAWGATAPPAVTLTTFGVIAAPYADMIAVTSFSGTADDMDSINLRAAGTRLVCVPTSGHTITVRNNGGGTGNIRTRSGASTTLTCMTLVCDGTLWHEV